MTGRYNSIEDSNADVVFAQLERRMRNLETLVGGDQGVLYSRLVRVSSVGPFTSTSYVDVPGLSIVYPKRSSLTLLRATIKASGFVNTLSTKVDFGVDITDGATTYNDVDVAGYFFNAAADHRHWGYGRDFPDNILSGTRLVAGNVTVQVVVKVSANQYSVDGNDLLQLEVTEVVPY